jgi:hypothetical protein
MMDCPKCGRRLRIDPLRIGRYVCDPCELAWIEKPDDPSTWIENQKKEKDHGMGTRRSPGA